VKGFLQVLQSKRVYRVGGGYIVSAWVILQVAAIVFPSLDLPSWSMKAVLDVLLLGFVPALLLGWHLDLRRARVERSCVLNKNAAEGPQSPSEQTLLGEGGARLDAKRQAKQIAPCGETPEKISVSRLPITGSDVFGREEDVAFLDRAWANKDINVVTIVAWGGVGKSTLLNHWLRRMAAEQYRSAQLVFGWSFYRQGTSGDTSSADEFLDAALGWFGDPDPRLGTSWEKGERLAKLVAHRRTLLVLDGLEPLQNPPGPQEGRLREPSLQALLRELAAFNTGLCVITTRTPVADIADYERTSALRRELDQLSSEAGAKLLRALGVTGEEAELRNASDEFSGHCLALTLLGSYLTDAFSGDIRFRKEVSERLEKRPTWSPCSKSNGVLPNLAWRGS